LKKNLPLLLFISVCVIDFLGIYFENQILIYVAKPLIIVSLFWYYSVHTKTMNKLFVAGLFFSFLGDVFLLGKGELYFILGLGSFLTAHVFYIIMVLKHIVKVKRNQLLLASIPYLMIFLLLLNLLYESLGTMKIPVIVYAITISVFGTVSLLLFLQKIINTNLLLVIGVFVFITSDSILAINLFYKPKSFYPLLIMITYVLAQFLICKFVLKQKTIS